MKLHVTQRDYVCVFYFLGKQWRKIKQVVVRNTILFFLFCSFLLAERDKKILKIHVQPMRLTVHLSPCRQMAAGRMLRLLRQWHRPQKDPGAFIRILPTEYIHLFASPPKNKTWTDLAIHSIKQRNSLSHSFERYCEILNRLKKKKDISSAYNIWDTNKNFHSENPNSRWTFVQISCCIQRPGVTYSLTMFSCHDNKIMIK